MNSFQMITRSKTNNRVARPGKRYDLVLAGTALVVACLLTGCARSPASRHYVFAPREGWQQVAVRDSVSSDYTIRFALVKLPAYLDRPHIVTRTSDNEIVLDKFNRWGMSLSQTVTELLGGTIARQLTNAYVDVITATSSRQSGYLVQADIVRLDGFIGGPVELIAQWQVTRGGSDPVVLIQRLSRFEVGSTEKNIAAYVEAVRELVARMGEEIADIIEQDRETLTP
ncbi:MAG TPA: PqiC family protein [Kiritimatiellia bacterium]|nr:PqiC family protein [Kiritimatiellia bacterium]HMO99609.1 PqiC family protein [Kiritimatiellia bacterium]HMP96708.1 PqiC family protein [Kiritimatiellia bacterium]